MRALLCLAAILCCISAQSCPPNYKLSEGRCVRALYLEVQQVLNNVLPQARTECAKDGATLPIIRSDEDNTVFNNIVNSFGLKGKNPYLVLDMVCNAATRKLQWIDGSTITYTPKGSSDISFDCVDDYNYWSNIQTDSSRIDTILCVTIDQEEQCGGYTLMDDAKIPKPCYKVFSEPLPWNAAQKQCDADYGSLITINNADENKFFWRTAVTNNFIEGMHIGAHQSSADPSVWTWVDGEVPFGGKTYDNFISSFPIPGAGACASMLTESASALWINEDCANNKQPFICRREDFSLKFKDCPVDPPKAGDIIFSPGFPNSNTPCEYVLFVAANKLIELEILTLITDINKDFLEIFEGPSGSDLLANLTGSILTSMKIRTTASNVIRVNWITNGVGANRGFRVRYSEVNP